MLEEEEEEQESILIENLDIIMNFTPINSI